jgi:hypothetical protein
MPCRQRSCHHRIVSTSSAWSDHPYASRMRRGQRASGRQIVEFADQLGKSYEALVGGDVSGLARFPGNVPVQETQYFPALVVGSKKPGCPAPAGFLEQMEEPVDELRPGRGRTAHRVTYADHGTDETAGQLRHRFQCGARTRASAMTSQVLGVRDARGAVGPDVGLAGVFPAADGTRAGRGRGLGAARALDGRVDHEVGRIAA